MNRLRCAQVSSRASGANPYRSEVLPQGLVGVDGQRVHALGDRRLPVVEGVAPEQPGQPLAPLDLGDQHPASPPGGRHGEPGRDRRLPGPALARDDQQPSLFQHLQHGPPS
jgi:hypothetical protein